jgi:UDP-N-acetylglucosamine 2-epimerase (non-hydrolysing)
MKIAPLIKAIKKANNKKNRIVWKLVHTGQHYDQSMSKVFFDDLDIPEPDIYLGIGSGSHAVQTANVMLAFEKVCLEEKPDIVVVVGDVNSTVACSLVASKLGIKIAHVEAGLRSYDRSMPEEINRVLTDAISDYLFTTCEDAAENLLKEGIAENQIRFVGNVMIDTLLSFKQKSEESDTERPVTITEGTNVLAGTDPDKINAYAAERIIDALLEN